MCRFWCLIDFLILNAIKSAQEQSETQIEANFNLFRETKENMCKRDDDSHAL